MPLTRYACPRCGACLHTDDLLEGMCLTGGCGKSFDRGLGDRPDLPLFSEANTDTDVDTDTDSGDSDEETEGQKTNVVEVVVNTDADSDTDSEDSETAERQSLPKHTDSTEI